jgi:sugar/nucleoside kinase (ribokinase family)
MSFDPGHEWWVDQPPEAMGLLALTDYLLVNDQEFRALGGLGDQADDATVAGVILDRCDNVCATLVAKRYDRVLEFRPAGAGVRVSEYMQARVNRGRIVDDTGAGDVFAAGILAALTSRRLQFELGAILGLKMARHKLLSVGDQGYGDFAAISQEFVRGLVAGSIRA